MTVTDPEPPPGWLLATTGAIGVAGGFAPGWDDGEGCCSLFHIWHYVSTIPANILSMVEINHARWFLSN
jgi:hypothetical protein